MISLDYRVGSGEMAKPLRRLGVPVRVRFLKYGDCSFEGHGPHGDVRIGIERKRLPDLLACMVDGRFSGRQLPGLIETYNVVYLILEGSYRPSDSGLLQDAMTFNGKRKGVEVLRWSDPRHLQRMMYSDFDHYLSTIEQKGGIIIRRTANLRETVYLIHSLYGWWQKPWSKHQSLRPLMKVLHRRLRDTEKDPEPEAIRMGRASCFRKMMAQIPGLLWERTAWLEKEYGNLPTLMTATQQDLQRVHGIGPKLAASIWTTLHARQT